MYIYMHIHPSTLQNTSSLEPRQPTKRKAAAASGSTPPPGAERRRFERLPGGVSERLAVAEAPKIQRSMASGIQHCRRREILSLSFVEGVDKYTGIYVGYPYFLLFPHAVWIA